MAEEKPHELLIIKRARGGGDHGHGGAWKIAFADFMTAMMALFLVLWLISATNEKTKASLARYFNPVKLVDLTIQKRGLNDPIEHSIEDAVDNNPAHSKSMPPPKSQRKDRTKREAKPQKSSAAAYLPTHSEAALFRDPYAVLGEIAAAGGAVKTVQADHSNVGAAASFQDPFQTAAPELPKPTPEQPAQTASSESSAAIAPPSRTADVPPSQAAKKADVKPVSSVPAAASATTAPPSSKEAALSATDKAPSTSAKAQSSKAREDHSEKQPLTAAASTEREVARLKQEIAKILGKSAAPKIEVKSTRRGILISLTDGMDYAMFAIGSAEPQARTVQIMEKIAHILKTAKGTIVISGHTDGRRYRSRNYDNWRLSTARAQMALYMLVRGGLDEKRVERIEGAADHDLKLPGDPMAAQNRRIEILLREKL